MFAPPVWAASIGQALAAATATDEEIAARFEGARDRYTVPEQRLLSYLLLDEEALKARAAVTEAELETYFRANREQWKEREQVCARHVLVKFYHQCQEDVASV